MTISFNCVCKPFCGGVFIGAVLACPVVAAGDQDLLWEVPQPSATTYTTSESVVFEQTFAMDQEVADDFEASGFIQAITVPGHGCASCAPAEVEGGWVRVYEWTANGPGALQHERFVSADGGDFTWDGTNPYHVWITLDDPIPVDGWHFISVQVAFGETGGVWRFKQNNRTNPINEPVHVRDNLDGGAWEQDHFFSTPINADFAISIYGDAGATVPIVDSVDRETVTGSDRITVSGNGFGSPGNGELLVGGVPAIVTRWSSTEIIGYIPEGLPVGGTDLVVANLGVSSDPLGVTIVAREQTGRVKWVFEGDGDYTTFAPGIGPDGTIYFDDIDGNLYAISPDGGLLWIVDALLGQQGNGSEAAVTVGADGTVYVGTNPLGPTVEVVAFNPDGTHKWTFTAPEAITFVAGPGGGPDGRIYGVLSGAQLLGQSYDVFAINADGSTAWTAGADPVVYEDAAGGFELAFAPSSPGGPIDRLVFSADLYAVETFGRVWSFDLADGSQEFAAEMNPAGPGTTLGNCQIAADRQSGAFYGIEFNGIGGGGFGLQAFGPNGERLWRFDPDIASTVTHPAVGPDGSVYLGWDLTRLSSVGSDGGERWTTIRPGFGYLGPVPSPTDPQLLAIGRFTGGGGGALIESRSTDDGELLWSQEITDDTGDPVSPFSEPRFTRDGRTAYFPALELPITPTSTYRIFAIDMFDERSGPPGDLSGDGMVDLTDLNIVLSAFGVSDEGDANDDGVTNLADLNIVLSEFGMNT